MIFALRVDIDTEKGLVNGVPRLVKLLDDFNYRASFYIPTGGESSLFEVIRHRKSIDGGKPRVKDVKGAKGAKSVKTPSKLTLFEKARSVLFPHNFMIKHQDILHNLIAKGHELGVHGWKHRLWTHNLENLDINLHFERMISDYRSVFGKRPVSFAAPAFRINTNVLRALDRFHFKVASDLPGERPFHPQINGVPLKHVQVPITLREGNEPFIEHFRYLSAKNLLEKLKKGMRKEFNSLYIHAAYECLHHHDLLRNLFKHLKRSKPTIEVKTIEEVAYAYSKSESASKPT